MEPNYLRSKEISYELKIRGLDSSGDVDRKRKTLRGALHQEVSQRTLSLVPSTHPYSYADDVKEISETINDLKGLIDKFSGTPADSGYKRISARLIHVGGRLQRVTVTNEAEEAQHKELLFQILDLENDIALKTSLPSETPSTIPTTSVLNPISLPAPSRNYVAPYKWNVQFSGSIKESVNSFLEKVEMLQQARGVSKSDLFMSACDLFKGDAWIWFLNNKSSFNNWDELIKKLKEDFLPYFYEDDLWREINNRTQGSHERVTIFISVMQNLFNRLPNKPDELSIVNKIRCNLLPYYTSRLALEQPKTVTELSSLCKRLEEAQTWSNRYKPPPTRKFGLLEPDLSYSNTDFPSTSQYPRTTFKSNVAALSSPRCWNCNIVGHTFNECRKTKNIFCYGCGLKNVTKNKCSRCNSKNLPTGASHLDALTGSSSRPSPEQSNPSVTPAQSGTIPKQRKAKGKGKRSPR